MMMSLKKLYTLGVRVVGHGVVVVGGGGGGSTTAGDAFMGGLVATSRRHYSKGEKKKPKGNVKPGVRKQREREAAAAAAAAEAAKKAALVPPIDFTSEEKLTVKLASDGAVEAFNLSGLLKVLIPQSQNNKFRVKIEYMGSPDIHFHPMSNKIDQSIFADKDILVAKAHDSPFPTRPLHWSLNAKDKSNIPIFIKCGTSPIGEKTQVMIEYEAFDLFDLQKVNISVTNKTGEAEIQTITGGGRGWNDPGMAKESKVHLYVETIDGSNRKGTIQFLVPGAVEVSDFLPITVKFASKSTYSNLELSVEPVKKNSDPLKFVQHNYLKTESYEIN